MIPLSSSLFLTSLECLRRAWLTVRNGLEAAPGGRRLEDGLSLLHLAQSVFPEARRPLQEAPLAERAAATKALMEDPSVTAIVDGWASSGGLAGKAEILERTERGWTLCMVKASSTVKGRQIDEAAFIAAILKDMGCPVSRCEILVVNKEYDWQGGPLDPNMLLKAEDVTHPALRGSGGLMNRARRALDSLQRPQPPSVVRKAACRSCPMQSACYGGSLPATDVVFFPGFRRSLAETLNSEGIVDVRELPDDLHLTESQSRHLERARLTEACAHSRLPGLLAAIRRPALYVDFEVDQPALPWVAGSGPFVPVPFQHHSEWEEAPGVSGGRHSFLWPLDAPGDADPRVGFVSALLPLARRAASIIIYSDFELRTAEQLARQGVPGASELAELFRAKTVDLLEVVKEGLAHPGFLSGHSIKTVLPALCPEEAHAYSSLEVQDGDMAVDVFRVLKDPGASSRERDEAGAALRVYCAQDVKAMVDIVAALREFASGVRS